MKRKHFANALFIMLLFALNSGKIMAQTTVESNPKFDNLLNEKKKINNSITTTDKYKIQIFYGDSQNARKVLTEFKQHFKDIDGTILFSSPNYKVQVGNFKTKIEADRMRLEILKKYPDALVVRPSRKQ